MPLNGDGTYILPSPAFPAIPDTVIESGKYNEILLDLQEALSLALYRDGQAVWTSSQDAGGYGLTRLTSISGLETVTAASGGVEFTGAYNFVTSPTAPTPATSDDSTKVATTEYVNNVAMTAALPSQTGNANKWLKTDGTDANWALLPGSSGTTITGSVTLTVSSPAAMVVTPAGYGRFATLPDATTCSEWVTLFSWFNAGSYPYGVKNSAGEYIGWITPGTGASVSLSDNSTPTGVWGNIGLSPVGVTAEYINYGIGGTIAKLTRLALDSTRTLFVAGANSTIAVVYDASTYTWGTAVAVRSGALSLAVLAGTNKALVVSATTTALEVVALSITGTAVTVETATKATATLSSSLLVFGQFIAVGTSFAFSYSRTGNVSAVRAVALSGVTPTIGGEAVLSAAVELEAPLFAVGNVLRTVIASATTLYCKPFTVSGSTLTPGTEATTTTDNTLLKVFLNPSGNIVILYADGLLRVAIVKLSGTVEAISSVSTGEVANDLDTDYIDITATKSLVIFGNTTAGTLFAALVTDTAGTASIGSTLPVVAGGGTNNDDVAVLWVSSNIARVAGTWIGGNADTAAVSLDCSGTTPVLVTTSTLPNSTSSAVSKFSSSNRYGVRPPSRLVNGQKALAISGDSSTTFDSFVLGDGYILIPALTPRTRNGEALNSPGATLAESWVSSSISDAVGPLIRRVELAV